MEHVRVRNFTETGRRLPDVTLPLSKSAVAVAIIKRISKGSGEMDGDTLADLDSGRIHFSTLAKLFQRSELERAVKIRLADVDLTQDEREQLLSLLKVDKRAWSASMGGEHAADRFGINRYAAPRGSRRDTFGGGAGRGDSGDPEGKGKITKSLRKAMAFRATVDAAKEAGWRVTSSLPDGVGLSMHNSRRLGESLTIDASGQWECQARGGARLAAGSGPEGLD